MYPGACDAEVTSASQTIDQTITLQGGPITQDKFMRLLDLFFFFKQKTAYEMIWTGVQTCALPIWAPPLFPDPAPRGTTGMRRTREKASTFCTSAALRACTAACGG